nr:hypothetical protein [Calidifontibacillus oryziterrae]
MLVMLSGCLYPKEKLAQNRIPYKDQLNIVQNAVDQFQQAENGILPIKTKESSTPIYQKYVIDFNKLIPRFLAEAPASAFESGGIFQYVLVNVETDPTVKLLDLTSVDPIRELKLRIKFYKEKNGYPPFKDTLVPGYYLLDYEKLGYGENPPYVRSPYSQKNLSLFIDTNGEIFVDYSPDLFEALQTFENDYQTGDDIRELLVNHYDFVPAFSVPYTIKDNEPIFLTE